MGRKTLAPVAVLGLYTETPLHCGAEADSGYVDLPVQRERHTHHPVIPGSTLKGVLRDEMKGALSDGDGGTHVQVFGSEDARTPGGVSFGDGVLVAFPMRSSHAPFHWVTCPFALERVGRALADVGAGAGAWPGGSPSPGEAWAQSDGEVLLEELRVRKQAHELFTAGDKAGGQARLHHLLRLLPGDERGFAYTRSIFLARLLVLHDNDFRQAVETGTEILTRIKLTALGTTTRLKEGEHPEIEGAGRQGNMFVEEVVPSETLFFASLRGQPGASSAALLQHMPPVIRLGGDETIGRGLTHATLWPQTQGGD